MVSKRHKPMRVRLVLAVVFAVAALGCAAKRVEPIPQPSAAAAAPRVDVEALIRRGCFRCFEQALAAAQANADREQAFEAAALIVLRAKDLGLPLSERIETMRTLMPAGSGWDVLLGIVLVMPGDPLSGERYGEASLAAFDQRRRVQISLDTWRAALTEPPGSPLFRAFLELSLACAFPSRDQTSADVAARALDRWPNVPAIAFRASTCSQDRASLLPTFRAADPEFLDAEYFQGRLAATSVVPDLDEALLHLTAAHDAFPESAAITTTLGDVRIQREEWAEALEQYDAVLERMPVHRDALLGRTISLSRLRRHEDGIAAATRMIDLGEWRLGEAYYWRAWNRFQLRQLDAAAGDRDRAKTLMSSPALYVLSGLIEWGQRHLPPAEEELQHALTLDFGQCDAALYLGAVRFERKERPESVAAFKQAVQCYDLSIGLRRKMIDDIRAGGGSEAGKARAIAGHERAIAEASEQREQAARDAAAVEKTL
jgi:tetratricopeptide (TPR) repeat protein